MITILVVEDEAYARQSLVKQIKEYDLKKQFHVLEAVNGEQGYEIYCQKEPELVMTDIRMPKMDGLELIKAIREKNSDTVVVMLSAYSDFEYARTALTYKAADYLLKPIEDDKLGECLDQFLHRNHFVKRETMITGQDITTRYISDCIKQQDTGDFVRKNMFKKIFPAYQILAFYLYGNRHLDQEKILSGLENQLDREIWAGFRLVQADGKLWIMVIHADIDAVFFPRKLLKVLEGEKYEACIGVSRQYEKPEDIAHAYQEAVEALEYKILIEERIITCEQHQKWDKRTYYLPENKESLLKTALEDRNANRAEYIMKEIFEEVEEKGKVDRQCLGLLFSQITIILRGVLQNAGANGLRESTASIRDFPSLRELEAYLTRISKNICSLRKKEGEQGGRDIVTAMMEYAKINYHQDITVKELAENVLFMNPAYLSHIFAEKTGISFSAWLRGVRMAHAKKFLEDGNLSVTEVASMSGYNDTSQFIRIFKQETGMTPKKYSDHVRGKEGFLVVGEREKKEGIML